MELISNCPYKDIQKALNEINFVIFAGVKIILNKTIWDKFAST